MDDIVDKYGEGNFSARGCGMFQGINCVNGEIAGKITSLAFQKGLIIETSGADDHVIKIFCPLIIKQENLEKGLDIIEESVKTICKKMDEIPEPTDYFDDVKVESNNH